MQALMVACPAQYWIGSENYSGKENRRSLIAGRRFESGLFRKDYAVLKARRGDMR